MPPSSKNRESLTKYVFVAAVGAASVTKLNFAPGSTGYIVCDAIIGAGAMFGIVSSGLPPKA